MVSVSYSSLYTYVILLYMPMILGKVKNRGSLFIHCIARLKSDNSYTVGLNIKSSKLQSLVN